MRLLLFIIGACIALQASALAQSASVTDTIDREIVREIDLTGDGKAERVSIHIVAKDVKSPFSWTLYVDSEEKRIYQYSSNDAWLNEFFCDDGYVSGCKGYIECKNQYYFQDLLHGIVLSGNGWYDLEGILDKTQENTLYPVGRRELRECCNVAGKEADNMLVNIESKFRQGKAVVLVVPQSPVHAGLRLIFVPEVGQFIRFYEE